MSTSAPWMDASLLRIGQEFAGYRVEAGLGRQSGIGRVYEATQLAFDRRVALKVFSAQALEGPDQQRNFTRTVRAHLRISHPAVAALEDWGTEPVPYMVMTLVRGPTLADLLEEGGLGDRRALEIIESVAGGLEAGRRSGLVYRRLQPRGVLMDEETGAALLGDFGAARPARHTDAIETGRLGPFADYISPEEVDGKAVTTASTVYSLGAILFEGLTGRPPYRSDQQWSTLGAHVDAPVRVPSAERSDLPPELDEVVARAMAKKPRERQRSPSRLVDEVNEAYPVEARPSPAAAKRRRRPRLRGGRVAVAAAVVAACAVLGALLSGGPEEASSQPAKRASTGDLSLRYPADWSEVQPTRKLAGLSLQGPVALTPPAGTLDSGELLAGRVEQGDLPAGAGEVVDLDGTLGRRYTGIREVGSTRSAVVYAVPTAGGQVITACLGPEGGSFGERCSRIASTMRPVRRGRALTVASPGYAKQLTAVVKRVGAVRVKGRRRLARARTRGGQRRVTRRLSRDYARLSRVMTRVEAPEPARASQAVAEGQLRRASRGFRDMSRAAAAEAPGRWIRARNGVRSAETRFQGALRSLRRQGYQVG